MGLQEAEFIMNSSLQQQAWIDSYVTLAKSKAIYKCECGHGIFVFIRKEYRKSSKYTAEIIHRSKSYKCSSKSPEGLTMRIYDRMVKSVSGYKCVFPLVPF